MSLTDPIATRSGLWPREAPRHSESLAEEKVYRTLKASLPKGWYAWHSLRLRGREDGEFGEADFVIADPNLPGVLILEVKGGQIEQRDGCWYQNGVLLESSPLDQAFSFRKTLLGRFNEENVKPPTIGVAVCFPDTFFEKQPGQDDLEGLVIGGQDLPFPMQWTSRYPNADNRNQKHVSRKDAKTQRKFLVFCDRKPGNKALIIGCEYQNYMR